MAIYENGKPLSEGSNNSSTENQVLELLLQKLDKLDNLEKLDKLSDALSNINVADNNSTGNISVKKESFDNTGTLDKLSKSMIIEREDKEDNIRDLGEIRETKKDVNDAIDFLSDLD
jgi:hypothetical protein